MKRIVEFEISSCSDCPNYTTCLFCHFGLGTKKTAEGFFTECPNAWHEKGYDRAAELEEQVRTLEEENSAYKALLTGYEIALKRYQQSEQCWIPADSGVKPELWQRILCTYKDMKDGVIFTGFESYMGTFERYSTYKVLAWMPAPKEYEEKVRPISKDIEQSIMNRFMRVE